MVAFVVMMITNYDLRSVALPLRRMIGDARNYRIGRTANYVVARLRSDHGGTGLGLGPVAIAPVLRRLLDEFVVRRPADDLATFWAEMAAWIRAEPGRMTNEGYAALAVVDTALWDLHSQSLGQPLWRLLGASQGAVPVYASGLDISLSEADLTAYYRVQAARGIRAGKLKVDGNLERNLRRLEIMKSTLGEQGDEPVLMIDANQSWGVEEAVRQINSLHARFPLSWVEEPVRFDDWNGWAEIAASVEVPLAGGENLVSEAQFDRLLETSATSVVQIELIKAGGISPALRIARSARSAGRRVSLINNPGCIFGPVAAAIHPAERMEIIDVGRAEALGWSYTVREGLLHLPSTPGHGRMVDVAGLESLPEPRPDAPLFC